MFFWLTDYQADRLLQTLRNLEGFPGNSKMDWLRGIVVSIQQNRSLNIDFPKIICLAGSKRFYVMYRKMEARFTAQGFIVLSPGYYPADPSTDPNLQIDQDQLVRLYNRKIDLCDELFVINENGFIGDRTRAKILYAHSLAKKISFLYPDLVPDWYKDLTENLEF